MLIAVSKLNPFSKSRRSRNSQDTTQATTEYTDDDSAANFNVSPDPEIKAATLANSAANPSGIKRKKAVNWGAVNAG